VEPWLELAGAVAALATPTAPAVAPRIVRLNMEQVFSLADAAQERGDIRVAEAAYEALAHDPNKQVRAEALFRHAKLLAKAGRLDSAATLFRTLLDERPDAIGARLELVRALDQMGDKDAAWRELRSAQASGLPSRVARLVDRYSEALRSARPMGASLEIAIAPDSNISRSTRSDTLGTVLGDFEIDDDSKAKSGLGLALRGQGYRRFGLGEGSSILVRASGFADLYKKSEFNDIALDVAAGPEFLAGRSRVQLELGATQRWFGQDPYLRSARVKGTWTLPVDRRSQLRIGASATLNDNQQNDLQDGKRFSAELAFERALSASMGAALTLSADREVARDPAYSTRGWRAGVMVWRDIGRTTFTAGVDFGQLRADDRLALFPDKRSDRYYRLSLGATLRQFTFAGFAPVTRLVIERNHSTIEFHDFKRTRTEFGVVRPF
jgi:tetratricopeptide (TPR) repeat protein